LDENDFRVKLNIYAFMKKLYTRQDYPTGFPIPPKHWPPEWRIEAPNVYTYPRIDPWYPNAKLQSLIPKQPWVEASIIKGREGKVPSASQMRRNVHRMSAFRCGVLREDFLEQMTLRPEQTWSHALSTNGPYYWAIDAHFCFRHAGVTELEYWSLRFVWDSIYSRTDGKGLYHVANYAKIFIEILEYRLYFTTVHAHLRCVNIVISLKTTARRTLYVPNVTG